MFAGHLAAGLALKKADKRINLGYLFFAALFLDFLLGIFVLLGLEQIIVPENFSELHYLRFVFPYSHGFLATIIWSLCAFIMAQFIFRKRNNRTRAGLIMAVAVFSHFFLDWLVHIPELPILGIGSSQIGLGLWNNLGLSLALEAFLVLIGLGIYQFSNPSPNAKTRYGVSILVLFVLLMTVLGQALSNKAPPTLGASISWIGQTLFIAGIAYWLDRKPRELNMQKIREIN
ncbi:MAG TPA: hypothetical protein ENK21_02655 [Trueperaceae bacterium]|nr:hypothetical protein [Trueperaceae bacterium]